MIPTASSKMSEVSPLDNSQLIVSSGEEELSQKCPKWPFSICFRSLNLRGATLKTLYLFGCIKGTMVASHDGFRWFFVSPETLSFVKRLWWVLLKVQPNGVAVLSFKNPRARFVLYRNFSEYLSLTIIEISWLWKLMWNWTRPPKTVGKLAVKLRMSWTNGTVIQTFSALPEH